MFWSFVNFCTFLFIFIIWWHLSGSQFKFTGKEIGWHTKNFTYEPISLSKRFLIFWHKCTCHNYYTFCFEAWFFSLLPSVTELYSTTWLWLIVYIQCHLSMQFHFWELRLFSISYYSRSYCDDYPYKFFSCLYSF